MADLRERVPGHSLVDELLRQWDAGAIHVDEATGAVSIDEEAEGWYRGVLGERRVASILEQFGEGWTVLHSVPVGARQTDIDHVLMGPAGVFTINTKYSPGKDVWVAGRGMYVGGFKQPYVLNSLREAAEASKRLSQIAGLTVPVTALIVFVDPAKITHKAAAGGDNYDPPVRVLRHTELDNVVLERQIFSAEQIERIVAAAIVPSTWHRNPAPSTPGAHITKEFVALEEALGARLATARVPANRAPRAVNQTARLRRYSSQPARNPRASRGRGKPKRSKLERAVSELAFPVIGFVAVWVWLANR